MRHNRFPPKREQADARGRSPLLPIACIVIVSVAAILACSVGVVPTQDASLEQTRVALQVQSTTLALESQRLTQQAGAQPPAVPTQAPPTQGPPPTQAPPPATSTPTSTASAEHVEGSLQRASYDPAAGWGEPDASEDFDGSSGAFKAVPGGAANSWYSGGQFHITFTTRGWWTWYYADLQSVDFYADVLIINGDQCVDRDSGGLLVRARTDVDAGLMFGITCGGGYYIGTTWISGPGGPVCTFTGHGISPFPAPPSEYDCSGLPVIRDSEYVDPGPGAVNRLGVLASGRQYSVYINGHQVDTFTDNFFYPLPWDLSHGFYALFLGTGQRNNSAVSFDDFSVWRYP